MNVLVFATYNVTPQDWAEFVKRASIPPQTHVEGGPTTITVPYVLVYSHSQDDYVSETKEISTTVNTEFGDQTYAELNTFIDSRILQLSKKELSQLYKRFFMVLDKRSQEDEKVILIEKTFESVDDEGNVVEDLLGEREDVEQREVWNIHRIPFDEANDFWTILSVKPGLEGEEYLQESYRPSLA